MPMTIKFGRIVTYNQENLSIMSHDPLATWLHIYSLQNISSSAKPMATKPSRVVMRETHP